MTMQQTPVQEMNGQTTQKKESAFRLALKQRVSERVENFIEKYSDLEDGWDMVLLETSSPLNLININPWYANYENGTGCVVNLKRLNDIRFVNKFLESANERLRLGGHILGCVETSQLRKQRIMAKFIYPLNQLYYFFDFWVKRVWPKLPYLKKSYFFITNGHNRVISEMETYGRLYSCGYKVVETLKADGLLYFAAEKVKKPEYNNGATYGPLITLNRIGKGGKPIKVYKFRTMYPYSEYLQQYVFEKYGLQSGGKFKDDPRINTLGKIMRKFWIDEVPMLWNLLKGDLNIVGVRPISNHYMSLYPKELQEYRKKFKPGFFPPFYADMPKTFDEIVASEERYLKAYEKNPLKTNLRVLFKSFYNVIFRKARSH